MYIIWYHCYITVPQGNPSIVPYKSGAVPILYFCLYTYSMLVVDMPCEKVTAESSSKMSSSHIKSYQEYLSKNKNEKLNHNVKQSSFK